MEVSEDVEDEIDGAFVREGAFRASSDLVDVLDKDVAEAALASKDEIVECIKER